MSDQLVHEVVQTHLSHLKLRFMAQHVDTAAEEAAKVEWTCLALPDRLLDLEASAHFERDGAMKSKLAQFPFTKTLDGFDFSFQPPTRERQVRELATMRSLAHGENAPLLSPRHRQDPACHCAGGRSPPHSAAASTSSL